MTDHVGKLEEGLLQAMQAIDNQIARAMQRTPSQREVHGVQKWEPYETRVENVTAWLLHAIGSEQVGMDSLLVLAQAYTKALRLVCDDLGVDGLGDIRSSYCLDAMEKIERDAQRAARELGDPELI